MPYKDPEKQKEHHKQHYQENREKIAERNKQYRQENREKIAERKKQHYQENREKIAERRKQYYQENREKIAERKKQYYQEKIKQRYQENREKFAERNKQYRQENREKIAERKKQYRERKKQEGTAGLYAIENKKTGQVYIGQSVFIEERWKKHKARLKRGVHMNHSLLRDYNEHGPQAFKYSVIKEINKEDFQSQEKLVEYLVNEEARLILEQIQLGNQLYNLSLKPVDVVRVLQQLGQRGELAEVTNG